MNRLQYIDTAKGICITLVVFVHIQKFFPGLEYPTDTFMNALRMPLYYFLSGLFFKKYEGFSSFIKKKINKLIIPLLFFYYLALIIFNFSHYILQIGVSNYYGWKYLFGFLYLNMYPNLYLWFLLSLFIANVFYYFLLIIFKNNNSFIIVSSLFLGLIGYIIIKNEIFIPTFLERTMYYFPLFIIGRIFKQYGGLDIKYKKNTEIILMIFFLVSAIIMSHFIHHPFIIIDFISCYITSVLAISFVLLFSKIYNKIPIITYYGRYSIIILVTHALVNQAFSYLILRLPVQNNHILLVTWFSFVMLSYIIIIPFMKHYFPYVTAQKNLIN